MDNSLKDRVLDALDIVEIIGERVDLRRKGREYVGLCPFHADHTPSMNVSPGKRIFKCWACGAGGDVIRFIQLHERIEFREALGMLAERAGITLEARPVDRRTTELRDQIRAAVTWARDYFRRNLHETPAGQAALAYARKRGMSDETVQTIGLGLALDGFDNLMIAAKRAGLRDDVLQHAGLIGTSERGKRYDRFRNRLIFPIHDRVGHPIAFGGRTLGDDPAKYLNSPETVLFNKSRVLYGFDLARRTIEQQRSAIIVEGYLDAVLLWQYGFQHALATLGTALTDAHVKLLRPLVSTLYLCFDADEAGTRAAERAVEVALRSQCEVRVVLLEGAKDPADCVVEGGAAAFERHLKGARDALEFKWLQTLSAFDDGRPGARRKAIEDYIGFISQAAVAGGVDPLQQDLMIGRLSELLGVPAERVFGLVQAAKRTQRARAAVPSAVDEASDYDAEIRGLPPGLVAAAESVLGPLVTDASSWQMVDDLVADSMRYSQTWQRLYGVLLELHQDVGEYSLKEVVARCEDGALCELVHRVRTRQRGADPGPESFRWARERLASELDLVRMEDLRRGLHPGTSGEADELRTFELLRTLASGQHAPLPAESRWGAASQS